MLRATTPCSPLAGQAPCMAGPSHACVAPFTAQNPSCACMHPCSLLPNPHQISGFVLGSVLVVQARPAWQLPAGRRASRTQPEPAPQPSGAALSTCPQLWQKHVRPRRVRTSWQSLFRKPTALAMWYSPMAKYSFLRTTAAASTRKGRRAHGRSAKVAQLTDRQSTNSRVTLSGPPAKDMRQGKRSRGSDILTS